MSSPDRLLTRASLILFMSLFSSTALAATNVFVPTGRGASQVVLNSSESMAYVLNVGDPSVSSVDLVRGIQDRKCILPVGDGEVPNSLGLSADGQYLFVSTSAATLHVLDAQAMSSIETSALFSSDLVFSNRWVS